MCRGTVKTRGDQRPSVGMGRSSTDRPYPCRVRVKNPADLTSSRSGWFTLRTGRSWRPLGSLGPSRSLGTRLALRPGRPVLTFGSRRPCRTGSASGSRRTLISLGSGRSGWSRGASFALGTRRTSLTLRPGWPRFTFGSGRAFSKSQLPELLLQRRDAILQQLHGINRWRRQLPCIPLD